MMDHRNTDSAESDFEFDNCVEEHLRSLGWHDSWSNAPNELLDPATKLAENDLGRKRRG
ncbi:hypothetical protein [Aliidiomarina minuta]|uniref:hypothetical protein n=1 Tax=Aliidiomarina minuta TaxID=880057 RepID=UPI0013002138|nr:hypothetical protein [Aliidiomarina minuta]